MPKIVIVEDELIAAEYLKELLYTNGFEVVSIIDNGKEAIEVIPRLNPDIVLMDIMLKDKISGSEVALHLKQFSPQTTVIFLTAYADNEMLEYAIESNCYGYLMKPYKEKEIINTLKIILARMKKPDMKENHLDSTLIIDKNFSFDEQQQKLLKNNREVELSKNAINLISLLCKNANTSVSNEQISLHIWNEIKNSTTIRTQIHRIRTKIGDDFIHNVNGLGYMIKTL